MTRLSRSGEGGCGELEPEPLRGVGGGRGQGQRGGPRGGGLPHSQGQLWVWRVWLRHPPHPRQEARGHSWGLVRSNVNFKGQFFKTWFSTPNLLQVSSAVCFLLSPGASFIRFSQKLQNIIHCFILIQRGNPESWCWRKFAQSSALADSGSWQNTGVQLGSLHRWKQVKIIEIT